MSRALRCAISCAVVWTAFLLLERAFPGTPSALLLPAALALGVTVALQVPPMSLQGSRKRQSLFVLTSGSVGALAALDFGPWFRGSEVQTQATLVSFVIEGPALLILLIVLIHTFNRLASPGKWSVPAVGAGVEGAVTFCVGALAWIWFPTLGVAAEKQVYSFAWGAALCTMLLLSLMMGRGTKPCAAPDDLARRR